MSVSFRKKGVKNRRRGGLHLVPFFQFEFNKPWPVITSQGFSIVTEVLRDERRMTTAGGGIYFIAAIPAYQDQ